MNNSLWIIWVSSCRVQGLCALTWFNGKKLTEQLLNVSLISFRSLQLRTSNKQWAKTLTGMKVPPPLTQQSSARAEPASQCSTVPTASTLSSNFMCKVGWEPNWFSIHIRGWRKNLWNGRRAKGDWFQNIQSLRCAGAWVKLKFTENSSNSSSVFSSWSCFVIWSWSPPLRSAACCSCL